MPDSAPSSPLAASRPASSYRWVPETRFGHWFLGTNVWERYVVTQAIGDLAQLLPPARRQARRILDAGCGPGVSLPLLDRHFRPEYLLGLDIDPKEIRRSAGPAARCAARTEVRRGDATRLDLPDASFDLVLCHQLLHHVVEQGVVLRELHRVLVPGGTLLVSESCRDFINSTPVRLLFRHPNAVQKTAAEYQQLVRAGGFEVDPARVTASIPFWSLPDWGFRYKLGWPRPKNAEPTEVLIAAYKPAA